MGGGGGGRGRQNKNNRPINLPKFISFSTDYKYTYHTLNIYEQYIYIHTYIIL